MSRYAKAGVPIALLALLPGVAWALGLGQIRSDTHIGQNLSARIPILAADANTLQGLSVGLASPDVYRQAGLREPDFLFNLKFKVARDANGPYVRVSSSQPVRLPFLNLLVHAHWASGEVTRRYTLLLNPPVFAAGESDAGVVAPSAPARQDVPVQQPAASPAYRTSPAPLRRPAARQPAQNPRIAQHYAVRPGQTLWSIAARLRPDAAIGMNRMMIALYRANPGAFSGNINRLKAGAVLRVPSRREIEAISSAAAGREVAGQNREWQSGQSAGGAARLAETMPLSNRTEPAGHATAGASNRTAAATAVGEVVLTAPEIGETTANAAAPGAGTSATVGGVAAASPDTAKFSASDTAGGKTSDAALAPAASAGGPAKVHSAELANLAAASRAVNKAPAVARPNAPDSVNTANTNTVGQTGSALRNWLTTPKGWIAIAVILLLIALLMVLFARRARAKRLPPSEGNAEFQTQDDAARAQDETEAATAPVAVVGTDALAAAVDEEPAQSSQEAAFETPLDETPVFARTDADFIGTPATGTKPDMAAAPIEADPYSWPGDSVGVDDEVFTVAKTAPEEETGAPARVAERAPDDMDALDFDLELDQLSESQPIRDTQDDFERTLGELSTMIETWVPENGEMPVALQSPPQAAVADEKEALNFEPDDAPVRFETNRETDLPADITPVAAVERNESGTRLDLARAYLDMGDRDAARDLLVEELDGDDGQQREAARRLLDSLDAAPESAVSPEAEPDRGTAPPELPGPDEEGAGADTQLDLARAYLDLGDRESARDLLEEVLDGGDEDRRKAAQELLETLEA